LLLALLGRLDRDPDNVVFFADEGGSWQVGVDWRPALAAYFRCLADGTPAEHFAREVDRAIADFADYDRPKHLATAAAIFIVGGGKGQLWGQESALQPAILHMQQTQTTSQGSQNGFPTYLAMYQVLDGAKSQAEMLTLTRTLSLKNFDPTFSEVLFLIVYWQGTCPANDINLTQAAGITWSDIVKNPSQLDSTFNVNLDFPQPLPMSGCVGLYYGGGPVLQGKVRMSANLDLTYRQANSNPNTVVNVGGGEYCFGQAQGCQNATAIDGEGFAVPTTLPAGHLLEIYGNISDSTFDGTSSYGPIPSGKSGAL
jgi:hypothetical protein